MKNSKKLVLIIVLNIMTIKIEDFDFDWCKTLKYYNR